jgi:hypothetical protein
MIIIHKLNNSMMIGIIKILFNKKIVLINHKIPFSHNRIKILNLT